LPFVFFFFSLPFSAFFSFFLAIRASFLFSKAVWIVSDEALPAPSFLRRLRPLYQIAHMLGFRVYIFLVNLKVSSNTYGNIGEGYMRVKKKRTKHSKDNFVRNQRRMKYDLIAAITKSMPIVRPRGSRREALNRLSDWNLPFKIPTAGGLKPVWNCNPGAKKSLTTKPAFFFELNLQTYCAIK
jgi:hypothetical protein